MGTTLNRVLNQQGRKARWLAEQIGVHESEVSRIRSGERNPSPEFRARAAAALGVGESELFPEAETAAA